MNRGHDTSIYYYFIIVKMAASTVEMAAPLLFYSTSRVFWSVMKRATTGYPK